MREHSEKPREEWLALPVPHSGIPREVAERARRNTELRLPTQKAGHRVWELTGGFAACAECGRRLIVHTVAPKGRKRGPYHYYVCPKKVEDDWRTACTSRNHRAEPLEERVRGFAVRLIGDPDVLREQVEQQVRAERESRPWLRNARKATSARERLAKLDLVADNYRAQQAEGMISMAKLREKLDVLSEEREGLEARLAVLANGEVRLRELKELPGLVEGYLADLPELFGPEVRVREYETVPELRTEDNPLGSYTLRPDRIMYLSDEELKTRRLAAEAAWSARFRELYARLGLRVAVYADGTVEITVGATNKNGVMPWNEPRRL